MRICHLQLNIELTDQKQEKVNLVSNYSYKDSKTEVLIELKLHVQQNMATKQL